jgi:hypothetical protein
MSTHRVAIFLSDLFDLFFPHTRRKAQRGRESFLPCSRHFELWGAQLGHNNLYNLFVETDIFLPRGIVDGVVLSNLAYVF